jgi:hypothetical protein
MVCRCRDTERKSVVDAAFKVASQSDLVSLRRLRGENVWLIQGEIASRIIWAYLVGERLDLDGRCIVRACSYNAAPVKVINSLVNN